jgi:DNA-binding MarR family transcriptional regulator
MDKKKTPGAGGRDPFDSLIGYHLRRLSVLAMNDFTKALAPLALKPADASILFALAARSGSTQSGMGRILGIRRANMAPLIGALLDRGLIERTAVDGRSQSLRLSVSGRALQRRAWKAAALHEEHLFGTLSAETRAALVELLRGLWQRRNAPPA